MAMGVGDTFERRVRWTHDEIVAFATEVGDTNPLHHDAAYAATTRFGGPIASGAQTVAFLIALCGAQSSPEQPGVGLEFTIEMRGAARAGEEIVFAWTVESVTASERPKGDVVSLNGAATAVGGRAILRARAKILLVANL
ncbi:MAG: MaoC family dehydratase [Candidatus Eremiobacteraeota bacterium]|nr:MaoC family dehydratase [Candidatus Eremiobacteraeota bacterium]